MFYEKNCKDPNPIYDAEGWDGWELSKDEVWAHFCCNRLWRPYNGLACSCGRYCHLNVGVIFATRADYDKVAKATLERLKND